MCSLLCSVIIELLFITGFTLHYWRLQWNIIWLDLWVWFAAYSWVDTPTTAILMDKNTWDSTQALERETPSCIEVFFPSLQEGFSLMNCGTPCLSCFTHQVPCHYFYGIDETPSKTYVFARVLFGSDDTEKSSESTSHGSFLIHQDGHQYDSHCGTTSTFWIMLSIALYVWFMWPWRFYIIHY